MDMKIKQIVSGAVSAIIVLSALAGCQGAGGTSTSTASGGVAISPEEYAAPVAGLVSGYELKVLSEEDEKYTVNLGYYNCDHMTAACVGQDAGIYEALGLTVTVTGNGQVPEAMSAGKMDMAYAGWTTALGARQKGTPLFIAAENHTGGAEYLVVSNDIKTPEDLIGKRIGAGGDPSNSMNWMEWTKELGIPSDITQYENFAMSDSDAYFALASGKLDAFLCCDPWGSMAEYEGTGRIMMRQNTDREAPLNHGTCCKVCMNTNFSQEHPELASRMLLAHSIGVQYMYLHPYLAAQIFANNYNVPAEVGLMTLYKKLNEEGRTISWDLNREFMDNQLKAMREYNVRDDLNSLNLDEYIDLTHLENSGVKDFDTFISEEVDPLFPRGMSFEEWRAKAVEVDNIVE